MKQYQTTLEAAHAWVREFNAIPMAVVEKLMQVSEDEITEVTPPAVGDVVYVFDTDGQHGEILSHRSDGHDLLYTVRLDNGDKVELTTSDFCCEPADLLPMWGTMWAFTDPTDVEWLNGYLGNHMQEMADCGFRIYEQEDYGYIFGINGAGYDFYEAHWVPLYKARGLKWSEEDVK